MSSQKKIKCVVWDLDETLWHGVLSEDPEVSLKLHIVDIVKALDARGILQSIASKNDAEFAQTIIRKYELSDYFLFPQINWNTKSSSIKRLSEKLNIGLDTFMLVDDQTFERDEVKAACPEVHCFDAEHYLQLLQSPMLMPDFITVESATRRQRYLEQQVRDCAERDFQGPSDEFLATLNMQLIISVAVESDLQRAEELTIRTNQLNATGVTYDYDQLKAFCHSPDHLLLVCELADRYGSYGKIGLVLLEHSEDVLCVKMLLVSCRVMSRGVGAQLLTYVMKYAASRGLELTAEYKPTGRNRIMQIIYGLANFKESQDCGDVKLLSNDLSVIPDFPDYMKVVASL
ncbi:HAD-IIIC family phosphatase [Pseudomonas sp. NPDC087598]|uniref:HAD-IIIC family phosphatase n=1 Tax=Pseudomonas sp. NPDC087598 TaxID=3364440 RepID=UPI003807FABE